MRDFRKGRPSFQMLLRESACRKSFEPRLINVFFHCLPKHCRYGKQETNTKFKQASEDVVVDKDKIAEHKKKAQELEERQRDHGYGGGSGSAVDMESKF